MEAHGSALSSLAKHEFTSSRIIMDAKRAKFDDMAQPCGNQMDDEARYDMLFKTYQTLCRKHSFGSHFTKVHVHPMQIGQVGSQEGNLQDDQSVHHYDHPIGASSSCPLHSTGEMPKAWTFKRVVDSGEQFMFLKPDCKGHDKLACRWATHVFRHAR